MNPIEFFKKAAGFDVAQFVRGAGNIITGFKSIAGTGGTFNVTLGPGTFATMIALSPATYSGYTYWVNDTGPAGGSLWFSDGTRWKPLNGRVLLAQAANGWLLPGVSASSTVTLTTNVATVTNGASVAHNIPATQFDGMNVYFPGSANIPAGWYPTFTRTSTTQYTFAYNHGNLSSESINSAAAYTAETTVVTHTLPGKALGPNGLILFMGFSECNNSAGTKTVKVKFGGNIVLQNAQTTTKSFRWFGPIVNNRGNVAVQVRSQETQGLAYGGLTSGIGGGATVGETINTDADVTLLHTLQCGSATDYECMYAYGIEIMVP